MDEISIPLFKQFFEGEIEVCFDWSRFAKSGGSVGLEIVMGNRALRALYPPWFLSSVTQTQVPYCEGDARPFSFDEIPRVIQGLDTQRQVKIARLEQEFSKFKAPIRLTVPAYHVGNGRFLIMDGNHRLAALALGKADFILLAFVAYGPRIPMCCRT